MRDRKGYDSIREKPPLAEALPSPAEVVATPLDFTSLIFILLSMFNTGFQGNVIWPFIPFMVEDFTGQLIPSSFLVLFWRWTTGIFYLVYHHNYD